MDSLKEDFSTLFPGVEEDTQTKKELDTKRDCQPKKKKEVIPMSEHEDTVLLCVLMAFL